MRSKNIMKLFTDSLELEKCGNYSEALKGYLSIISIDPSCKQALMNAGSLYARMSQLKEAIIFFQRSLLLSRDYVSYFNIGAIYYRLGNHKRSVMFLEKSREMRPDFYLPSLVMGLSYSQLGNTRAAEYNFRNVLKRRSDHTIALTALAVICYNSGRDDEALCYISALSAQNRSTARLSDMRFNILYSRGDYDRSLGEIKKIRKSSRGYAYYDEFIKSVPVELYSDRYGSIDDKIETLKSKEDNSEKNLISLSLCHLFKGEPDEALEYLFKARKMRQTG